MTLDFKNDNGVTFSEPVRLTVTKSGHCTLPISPYSKILNNIVTGTNPNFSLITMYSKSKHDVAVKSNWQFSHPTPEKLLKLLNCTDEP